MGGGEEEEEEEEEEGIWDYVARVRKKEVVYHVRCT
jgi:hypothetical protein